ncbi:uncharacterized protein LOC134223405 [Armigeres subalbatus]|uniref:uncharacterized protein LOC134223405 n=1 Tax=Armigeres subalbatus TaxID=124917 RepID=UPI002ED2DDD5
MHLPAYLISFCLLLCYANADVNEIVANDPPKSEEIQTCLVLTTNLQPDLEANTVLPEHGPVPESSSLTEVDVKIATEPEEVQPSGQLDSTHADYQGPYHYGKPKIPLEYGAPLPATDVPALPPPEGRNEIFEGEDYLPPSVDSDSSVRAKRHAKFASRRSV